MTGYCPDCGNTLCICAEVEADIKSGLVRRFDDPAKLRAYLLNDEGDSHSQTAPGFMTLTTLKKD